MSFVTYLEFLAVSLSESKYPKKRVCEPPIFRIEMFVQTQFQNMDNVVYPSLSRDDLNLTVEVGGKSSGRHS